MIDEIKRDDSKDYLKILKALIEIPFPVGRKLLADFLRGDWKNKSIIKNNLNELVWFDTLNWDQQKILDEISKLISKGMISEEPAEFNKFIKVLKISLRGQNEIINPSIGQQNFQVDRTEITNEDRKNFEEFSAFLEGFNEDQKKAITCTKEKILCIAGAGSGKTTVLTKRIEFLVKHRNVLPSRILAITFTRKAKREMDERLKNLNIETNVATFNSFCERVLRKNSSLIYSQPIRVQTYGDKIIAITMALDMLGLNMESVVDSYFSSSQRKFKTFEQLSNSFMNDCFTILDYHKVRGLEIEDFSKGLDGDDATNAKIIFEVCKFLREQMKLQGLRDFTDQILDTIKFFKRRPDLIPKYDYILVDEYQDVNAMQIDLLKLLSPKNLFVVGDPRQSIYGWRGSDIQFILDFNKKYPDCEVISLTKNYRSHKKIVNFMNSAISKMSLPDLDSHNNQDGKIVVLDFANEEAERKFILTEIKNSSLQRKEIFILSRTNKQIKEMSELLKQEGIPHVLKTEDIIKESEDAKEGELTLATVHAIKGLEAKKVFVMGANEQNFPCKASDHPIIEMIKLENYDKEEEEQRLFYVAVSRAKEELVITYSGAKTRYLPERLSF